ncbi:hypothetical protein [Corynebacterium uterequi]|uniref:Uncharacterized protein n=1 Tax=Corynebacterium uterequi TaxID=1072256 RepID=A0A0G3HCZ6_9CORY|nr:hypothetical protein [Corynebacterium uterequi]AKK10590.1 hypothetical protein CUTER_02885 [Corynebacterium uterequi]
MKFIIDPDSLAAVARATDSNSMHAYQARSGAQSALIGPAYSTASGYDQLGTIHGLSLHSHPGSAAEVLGLVAEELQSVADNLVTTRRAYQDQDTIVARVLRRADIGDSGAAALGLFSTGGLARTPGMHRGEVIVTPAVSLDALLAALGASDSGAVSGAMGVWANIIQAASNIAEGLIEASGYIGANNYGQTSDAIMARLQDSGRATRTIATNAGHFESTLSQLEPARLANIATVQALKTELTALAASGPEGTAVAEIAERAALAHNAVTTQAALAAITPRVMSLSDPLLSTAPNPTATLTTADGGVGFDGTRFIAPHGMVDSLLGYADAHPEQVSRINALTQAAARQAGMPDSPGLIHPETITTAPTTAGTITSPAPLTHAPASTPSSTAAIGTVAQSAVSPARWGAPTRGGDTGTTARAAASPVRSGWDSVSATTRYIMGPQPPRSKILVSDTLVQPSDGKAGTRWNGSASSNGYSSGGTGPRGGERGYRVAPEAPPRSSTPAPLSAEPASPGAGAARGATPASSPVMGGGFANPSRSDKRRAKPPKIMITEVERDANRLALLGEPRKVLPGVIGEWIFEDPDDPNGTYPNKI